MSCHLNVTENPPKEINKGVSVCVARLFEPLSGGTLMHQRVKSGSYLVKRPSSILAMVTRPLILACPKLIDPLALRSEDTTRAQDAYMWSGSSSAQANIGMTSPTTGDQYELSERLVDTPGLDDFCERQANSGVIDATGGMVQAMPPVGQFTRGPLQAEDRGKTIRPKAYYTIPFIGPSLGTYVFKWVPAPELVPM
ncbi:hypothetical protein BDN72DRAFT_506919 [Pluteus cervinus]|uniref:Uncharacterized protein n=1 Tax=Pluteus cervinus TaxID=181527 RepID=A0ACD3A521_9AGAR|nr:hypothetical protein BDN72DRAFT_506919 [Pluteus cervinus]